MKLNELEERFAALEARLNSEAESTNSEQVE